MAIVGLGIDLVSILDFTAQVDGPGAVFAEILLPGQPHNGIRAGAAAHSGSGRRCCRCCKCRVSTLSLLRWRTGTDSLDAQRLPGHWVIVLSQSETRKRNRSAQPRHRGPRVSVRETRRLLRLAQRRSTSSRRWRNHAGSRCGGGVDGQTGVRGRAESELGEPEGSRRSRQHALKLCAGCARLRAPGQQQRTKSANPRGELVFWLSVATGRVRGGPKPAVPRGGSAGGYGCGRVVTAGNAGGAGTITGLSADVYGPLCSITDLGNAALAITVGSVQRYRPHTYGITFNSSKGPTLDGRRRPDVVAPGE